MTNRLFLILTLLLSHLTGWSQIDTLRHLTGLVVDELTNKPIGQATVSIVGTDGSSVEIYANDSGVFHYDLKPSLTYLFVVGHKKYLNKTDKVTPDKSLDTLTFKLSGNVITDYFQEFTFSKNSSATNDTDNFTAWGLNDYQDTILRIKVIGYRAPDEDESIRLTRANKIIDGFVAAGANRQSFIAATADYPNIYYNWSMPVNGQVIKLDKNVKLTDDYIETISGDYKAAIFDFMRRVQLQWDKRK